MKWITLITLLFFQVRAYALDIDPEVYQDILSKAASYTELPGFENNVPPIIVLSEQDMYQEVCREDIDQCRGMAAFFDTEGYRILMRDDLDMYDDTDNSFLLHELVHALQFLSRGNDIFATCEEVMATEKQAYEAQNKYLRSRGQLFVAGAMLRFTSCPKDEN